jgi:hypothetical protein
MLGTSPHTSRWQNPQNWQSMQTIKSSTVAAGQPAAKSKSSTNGTNGDTRGFTPNRDEIASLAYKLYLESGSQEGRDLENWTKAEQILAQRSNGQKPSAQDKTGNRQEMGADRSRQQF